MTTTYENLQPPLRLENHNMSHVSKLAVAPEIVNGDALRFGERHHLQL